MRICVCLACLTLLLAGCNRPADKPAASTQPIQSKPVDPAVVLAFDGPGGRVSIGDSLDQAKKAFPAPKGAMVVGATNFAIFAREGWSWATEKPMEAFEVSLKDGKIVGIARSMGQPDKQKRDELVEQTLRQLGPPTAKTDGKTASLYAWEVKPNARFLMVMQQGLFGSEPLISTIAGHQDELKMFNYRVDDTESMVKQLDLGAEAMKGGTKDGRPTQ